MRNFRRNRHLIEEISENSNYSNENYRKAKKKLDFWKSSQRRKLVEIFRRFVFFCFFFFLKRRFFHSWRWKKILVLYSTLTIRLIFYSARKLYTFIRIEIITRTSSSYYVYFATSEAKLWINWDCCIVAVVW